MKKILVLMLVLGFASMATAALSLYVNGAPAESSTITLQTSETIWIGVYSDGTTDQGKHSGIVILDPSGLGQPGAWTGASIDHLQIPGGFVGVSPPVGIFVQTNADTGLFIGPGISSEFEFHCTGIGDVDLLLLDDLYGPVGFLTIHQIPEPITMALLGLGGLFLRRRR